MTRRPAASEDIPGPVPPNPVAPGQTDKPDIRQRLSLQIRRLTWELDRAGQRFRQWHARDNDLGRTDVRALLAIMSARRSGQAITIGALSEAVELTPPSTTALVDRLEAAGHVRRVRSAEDRRRVTLDLSDATWVAGKEYFDGLRGALDTTMAAYTDEQLQLIERFLGQAAAAVEDYGKPQPDLQ